MLIYTQAVKAQLGSLKAAFSRCGITPDAEKVIIAYEPMWAISTAGSDLALEPTQAAESHDLVRRSLDELFGHGFGAKTSIIFGGSVNASNAVGFFGHPDIDGGLVGAGMQTADGFSDVLRAFYGTGPQLSPSLPHPHDSIGLDRPIIRATEIVDVR